MFGQTRKSSRKASHAKQFRPGMEPLEKREMMTVNYYGGGVLPHVEVQGVYYGRDWSTNASLYQQTGQIEGFLKNVVNSSYMDMLTNAGYGVGRGTYDAGRIGLKDINKSYYLTDSQIRTDLQSYISSRGVAAADANRLYVVYVEPGVAIKNDHYKNETSQHDFLGYHGGFAGRDANGRAADIHYAVIAYPGGYNFTASSQGFKSNFDDLTAVTSHELAEAVTDPNVNYKGLGWYDYQRNGEIGDIAAGHFAYLNGYCVQLEVNRNDQLIAPAGSTPYNGRSFYTAAVNINQSSIVAGAGFQTTLTTSHGPSTSTGLAATSSSNSIGASSTTHSSALDALFAGWNAPKEDVHRLTPVGQQDLTPAISLTMNQPLSQR